MMGGNMFKWFKKKDVPAEDKTVDDADAIKAISEPAISLLKCVQDNPDRFICDEKLSRELYYKVVRLYDKQERLLFKALLRRNNKLLATTKDIFTEDDVEYIYSGVHEVYRAIREQREDNYRCKERRRISFIYCKQDKD